MIQMEKLESGELKYYQKINMYLYPSNHDDLYFRHIKDDLPPTDGSYILFARKDDDQNHPIVGFWHDGQNIPSFVASGTGLLIDTTIYCFWMPTPCIKFQNFAKIKFSP